MWWWDSAGSVTVLTGAGISTDSGIPDFRGPSGVWTLNPKAERRSTLRDYLEDPAVRVETWRHRLDNPIWRAEPNPGHRALARLEDAGPVHTIVTQNIDGLHQLAGSRNVLELHGTAWESECLSCARRLPMAQVLERVRAGDPDPRCLECGGIQKSATISFGQSLNADVLAAADRAARGCDLFLAIGSSLTVHPAAGLCDRAKHAGAVLVVLNAQPTPYDDIADEVIREPVGELLPRLAAKVGPEPPATP